jgi:SAM-dependent methyltransferase
MQRRLHSHATFPKFRVMNAPPQITDRPALLRNRRRATAMFLQDEVRAEAQERLIEVNRAFTAPAIVTAFPEIWTDFTTVVPDDDILAMSSGAQDVVIHALCLHWANDLVGQLVQCRHALRPDGLFLGFLFGGQTLHELRACLAQAESEVTGGLSPRVLPMAEIRDLGGLLQRAGFALPVADSFTKTVRYRNALHLMHDLRAMGEGNALSARLRRPTRRAVMARAAALYQDRFSDAEGRIPATFEIIALTGWAPDDSQQKPLRPGSAAQTLASALKTAETPLPRDHWDG